MKYETNYFDCECYSPEHTLRIVLTYDENNDEPPEVYTEIYLNQPNSFFKRIWIALKYIFGYKSQYGCWDCFNLQAKDTSKLMNILDTYDKLVEKYRISHKN